MTAQLPLDDRATCAELFDFACALNDKLADILARKACAMPLALDDPELVPLLERFACLRDNINEGENA